MTRASLQEHTTRQRARYEQADRTQKQALLDEVVAVTGMHRKAVIRLLRRPLRSAAAPSRAGRPRKYGPKVAAAVETLWQVYLEGGAGCHDCRNLWRRQSAILLCEWPAESICEARGGMMSDLAMHNARSSKTEDAGGASSGKRNIEQPCCFQDETGIGLPIGSREDLFLKSRNKNNPSAESFGAVHGHESDSRRQEIAFWWRLTEALIDSGQNLGLLLMMIRAEIVTELLQSDALRQLTNLIEPCVAAGLTKVRV